MRLPSTILELLSQADESKAALEAPGRRPLSYGGLRAHVVETVERLNSLGIGRNDPVAIVLPNGPTMASSFVAVASAATAAPLNPAYREEELEFYLGDLKAKLLLLERESGALARKVAELGAERIAVVGQRFDPRVAEAIDLVPVADVAQEDVVVQEVRAGYRIGERILRPARVRVGRLAQA